MDLMRRPILNHTNPLTTLGERGPAESDICARRSFVI
jgi:hypothetical protein